MIGIASKYVVELAAKFGMRESRLEHVFILVSREAATFTLPGRMGIVVSRSLLGLESS